MEIQSQGLRLRYSINLFFYEFIAMSWSIYSTLSSALHQFSYERGKMLASRWHDTTHVTNEKNTQKRRFIIDEFVSRVHKFIGKLLLDFHSLSPANLLRLNEFSEFPPQSLESTVRSSFALLSHRPRLPQQDTSNTIENEKYNSHLLKRTITLTISAVTLFRSPIPLILV